MNITVKQFYIATIIGVLLSWFFGFYENLTTVPKWGFYLGYVALYGLVVLSENHNKKLEKIERRLNNSENKDYE